MPRTRCVSSFQVSPKETLSLNLLLIYKHYPEMLSEHMPAFQLEAPKTIHAVHRLCICSIYDLMVLWYLDPCYSSSYPPHNTSPCSNSMSFFFSPLVHCGKQKKVLLMLSLLYIIYILSSCWEFLWNTLQVHTNLTVTDWLSSHTATLATWCLFKIASLKGENVYINHAYRLYYSESCSSLD